MTLRPNGAYTRRTQREEKAEFLCTLDETALALSVQFMHLHSEEMVCIFLCLHIKSC